ncbi:hypothetical protein PRIPAC_87600 [Pristionchus pacificus]|uniref:Uncharacterized protein n=1 Tax=Pristionchus pacificus TaxID=54126 RepID=A0A2A6CYW4_PRIPA|nr:hypothetical protein PRIPAC_87600 [Pristionchus pacificus]|eukprot:PDM83318.1 hypothetical protein PRIPAC_34950 [Pristionchus pacificus]
MTTADEDYQLRLRDMVVDRLDEAVSSTHFQHSNEPMVPILRTLCENLQWLVAGVSGKSDQAVDCVSSLRKLLKDKPRRECDTDRLISLVADALLIHLTGVVSGVVPKPKASMPITPATPCLTPIPKSESPPATTTTRTSPYGTRANDSVPAKKARLEAKINGLAKGKIESFQEESMKMFSDNNTTLTDLISKGSQPVEIRVGSSNEMREEENDPNDDSGVMDASGSGLEENPLIRLLQEQEKKNIIVRHVDGADDNSIEEDDQGDVSGEEYDFSSLLLNNSNGMLNDSIEFSDPFINEPPIFSPSVSTIRKNTRRSKPEKIAEKGCTRVNRDPNAPRQVISAYLCFVGEMRLRRNNGELHCNGGEFGQMLKNEWTKLTDRTRYEMQHEEDKRRYEAELAAWARSERRPVPGRKAYSFYVLEHFEKFKDENPELAEEEVITKLFVDWRDNADKAYYFQLQQRDKERFRNEMKIYTARMVQSGINVAAPGQVTITSKQKMNGSTKDLLTMNTENYLKNEILKHLEAAPFKFELAD